MKKKEIRLYLLLSFIVTLFLFFFVNEAKAEEDAIQKERKMIHDQLPYLAIKDQKIIKEKLARPKV